MILSFEPVSVANRLTRLAYSASLNELVLFQTVSRISFHFALLWRMISYLFNPDIHEEIQKQQQHSNFLMTPHFYQDRLTVKTFPEPVTLTPMRISRRWLNRLPKQYPFAHYALGSAGAITRTSIRLNNMCHAQSLWRVRNPDAIDEDNRLPKGNGTTKGRPRYFAGVVKERALGWHFETQQEALPRNTELCMAFSVCLL